MYLWLAYDISDHKQRRRVAKLCERAGLQRIQKSNFLGKLKAKRARKLEKEVQQHIEPANDKLYCLTLDRPTFRRMRRYGLDFDHAGLDARFQNLFF